MSFVKYNDTIKIGDVVIIMLGHNSLLQTHIQENGVMQTKYGAIKSNDIIGTPYGRKYECSKGFVYLLHATPALWTITLPHRTQILYSTNISMIIYELDLRPGSIVVESGTGSGSLSHSILRTIAPDGHLYTFDFHEQRVNKAEKEFIDHGFKDFVTVKQADACEQGFDLEDIADAVFLDLPKPWEAIKHAKKSIKIDGGKICSFSPCIEQVQRVCIELEYQGFSDTKTIECIQRDFDVRTSPMVCVDTGHADKFLESNQLIGKYEINDTESKVDNKFVYKCATPSPVMPGHTGYLTFSSLYNK